MAKAGELRVVQRIAEVREAVRAARAEGRTVGLVPTMGALHAGHARLVEAAAADCGCVVVSIFVNPTQFGPGEDLARYPRTPEADHTLCRQAGAHRVSRRWEGEHRPGHFRGVATVVLKLFQIVGPDRAYFGEKDYQQLQVIRRMVTELDVPVEVVGVPTVREPDGLALSSRNRYLSPDERATAAVLSRALWEARQAAGSGQLDANSIRQILRSTLEFSPGVAIDYADVVDADSLEPLDRLDAGRPARALIAVRLPSARLIDNAPLPRPGEPA